MVLLRGRPEDPNAYPSLADVGFLAAVPFAFLGIRAFWSAPRGTSSRWRVWFDGVIVAICPDIDCVGIRAEVVALQQQQTKILDLAYPSATSYRYDLILAIRGRPEQRQDGLPPRCVALYSIADSAFAYLNAQGAFGAWATSSTRMVCGHSC